MKKQILLALMAIAFIACNEKPKQLGGFKSIAPVSDTSRRHLPPNYSQCNVVDANYNRQKHWIILADSSFQGYSANDVYEEGDYKNGLKEGIWIYYNHDHSIDCKVEYKDDKPLKTISGQ